ncbi:galactokinase [Qipengyuania sp. XHP0207]|uniref:galactokinase n=1 Tax=Qipengyuania sp. XHP0207 TaxID=3038078 RepID=UPI00241F37FC|nr:galactokinase [Qipengyuania sp. XHP0207]MDG5746761.1 galactokinase [Qipengyuania sp. XHP0207]
MPALDAARDCFERNFGTSPDGVAFAPGRVNIIGDHTDYNDGFVLPMPLALGTAVAFKRRGSDLIDARAGDYGDAALLIRPDDKVPLQDGWRSLVHGMIHLLREEGLVAGGLDLAIAGDLPRGSGLSSSASLCIAIARAAFDAAGQMIESPTRVAQIAQQVEHRYAGVACGIMDQMVIAAGEAGRAMLLDCGTLEWRQIDLPTDWSVLVLQSGVTRELVDGAYNARRADCEAACRTLGVATLRDVAPGSSGLSTLAGTEALRAQHVVGEIERTRQAADAIAERDIGRLGLLLREAHASMRDLFEASHPQVDAQVDWLNEIIGPAGGARMTGGGFGGSIVLVCEASARERIEAAVEQVGKPQYGLGDLVIRAHG